MIETAMDLEEIDRPALAFLRGKSMPRPDVPLSNDPTNFYAPNSAAVIAMCEHVGFSKVEKFVVSSPVGPRGFFYAFV